MKLLKRLLYAEIDGVTHYHTESGWTPEDQLNQAWFDDQDEQEFEDMVFNGNFRCLVDEGKTDCDYYDEDEEMRVVLDLCVRDSFKQ